jgi:outer membrane lipoprotein-sorting protein
MTGIKVEGPMMTTHIYPLLLCFASVPLLATGGGLQEVLSKMDSAAPKFSGMAANLEKIDYTKVIDDKSIESGNILVRRPKPHYLQVKIEIVKPDQRFILLNGQKAELYYPKIKTVQEIDLGKQSDLVNSVILVGFGVTGKELQANYLVKFVGEETVSNQKTFHLELVPKDANLKSKLSKMEIWMAEDGSLPVQQKVVLPSGNYTMFAYSNIKYNPPLTDQDLSLKLPKNVKREYPQRDRN